MEIERISDEEVRTLNNTIDGILGREMTEEEQYEVSQLISLANKIEDALGE